MSKALDSGKTLDIIPFVGGFHLPFFPQVGKGSWKPQQRMESEETKGSQEQGSHSPEGYIKNRVFGLVMMGGMGEITGKTAVRARVALGTGGHNILSGKG